MKDEKWERSMIYCGSCWLGGDFFRSKTNSADYHDEMNSEHFIEWFTQ